MTNLKFTTLDTGSGSLEKTITLVTGDTEAVLIDAGFTRADGHRAVAAVLDSGKRLTAVFISAGDPDFYFGAEVVEDASPMRSSSPPPTSSSTSITATRRN